MKAKTILAAVLVTLLPGLSMSLACERHEQIRQSCATDHVWDPDQGTCVPNPSA